MADELPKKDFKDRYGKKQGDAVRYATATNIVKKKEGIKEDGHEDVSSSKRMCQTIIEDATQIKSKLDSMGPEDKLDTWWTNKLAKSADNLNSARDYIVNPIEEDLQEQSMRQKAVAIAKKMAGNMTGAVKEIEKLMKGLSNDPVVATTLKRVNENLEEKIKPFMISYSKQGQHAGFKDADSLPEIQKMAQDLRKRGFTIDKMGRYNPPVKEELSMKATFKNGVDKTFKGKTASDINKQVKEYEKKHNTGLQHDGPMIKEDNLQEFTRSQLDTLEKQFADLKGKTISIDRANQLRKIFDRIPDAFLNDLRKRKIPFLSGLALSRMIQKGMPVKEETELEEKKLMVKKGDKVREINDFEWRTYSQMGYKLIGKDGDVMKEDRYAGARKVFETITAVKNKAEKTGMPYSILKKVYDRGMAAWKGGHRPGATQQQWALARVNSFVTKSSGTWGGADKDLAAKVRGSKK
jgi:predicted DNA binding CopG/RHH family protein